MKCQRALSYRILRMYLLLLHFFAMTQCIASPSNSAAAPPELRLKGGSAGVPLGEMLSPENKRSNSIFPESPPKSSPFYVSNGDNLQPQPARSTVSPSVHFAHDPFSVPLTGPARRLFPHASFGMPLLSNPGATRKDYYYVPIKYYDNNVETYRTLYVKVTEEDEVRTVAQRAARLLHGSIPPQQATLFLNDENLPLSKRLLKYYYTSVLNGGSLALDYIWKKETPRNPYASSP